MTLLGSSVRENKRMGTNTNLTTHTHTHSPGSNGLDVTSLVSGLDFEHTRNMAERRNVTTSVVLIPCDKNDPIQTLNLSTDCLLQDIQNWLCPETPDNVVPTLLLRATHRAAGLAAYQEPHSRTPNIRATRLGMACGRFALRLRGPIILVAPGDAFQPPTDLARDDVVAAASFGPDLRPEILRELALSIDNVEGKDCPLCPDWLASAAQSNYHDQSVLQKLAALFIRTEEANTGSSMDLNAACQSVGDANDDFSSINDVVTTRPGEVATRLTLCLHCRRPASTLCPGCHGVYFCDAPRRCRQQG
jgi:hypothetical protein